MAVGVVERGGRRWAGTATVLAVALVMAGCMAGESSDTGADAAGWHPVSAPPRDLPSRSPLWVSDELVFFDYLPTEGHSLAYRPDTDTWRSVASPPAPGPGTAWAMVSTGTQVVAVSQTATAVYTPKSDRWTPLTAPPVAPPVAGSRFLGDRDNPIESLVWTGREVALAYRFGGKLFALDVLRGRWRSLPSTGVNANTLLATDAGLVVIVDYWGRRPSTHLLRPGAKQWRPVPNMPPQMYPKAVAGNVVVAAGLRPGTNETEGGRYVLPEGRWDPLPRAPVSAYAGVTLTEGGMVALWQGSRSGRPERPSGVLLRPGGDWEVIPPPPGRIGGRLLAAGEDLLVLEQTAPAAPHRLVARFRPPKSPGPGLETVPVAEPTGVCRAAWFSARTSGNRGSRGTNYIVYLTNRSDQVCTLLGPTEISATDADGAPLDFPDARSLDVGPAITAVPDVPTAAEMVVWMHWGTSTGPQRRKPECVDAPYAGHLYLSWPGSEGRVEVALPASSMDRLPLCNADVRPFRDAWPTW